MGSLHDIRMKNSGLPSAIGSCGGLATTVEALHPETIRIGTVEVNPGARSVLVGGMPVDLGGRAFDLLMVLLDARGQIVAKQDLLARVWPSVTVIESNLKVQLSLLRRALGAERWRVKTISGRGYLLVAHDACSTRDALPASLPAQPENRPLVIVVDADRDVQAMVMQTLSDLLRAIDGMRHLTVVVPNAQSRHHAC